MCLEAVFLSSFCVLGCYIIAKCTDPTCNSNIPAPLPPLPPPPPPSSLLSPNPSSLPKIWQGAKKPKKKIKAEGEGSTPWVLDLDFVPPPEMCLSDDEVSTVRLRWAVSHSLNNQDTTFINSLGHPPWVYEMQPGCVNVASFLGHVEVSCYSATHEQLACRSTRVHSRVTRKPHACAPSLYVNIRVHASAMRVTCVCARVTSACSTRKCISVASYPGLSHPERKWRAWVRG